MSAAAATPTHPRQAAPAGRSRSSAGSSTTASKSPPHSVNARSQRHHRPRVHLRHRRPRPDPRPHRPGPAARRPAPEKISRVAAARLDAEPQPKLAPSPRAPRALPCEAQPPSSRPAQPQSTSPTAASCLANLPTPEQIAAKVRRQPIGAVLADICRDLGIAPSHPLWDELHLAMNEYGGNYIRLVMGPAQPGLPDRPHRRPAQSQTRHPARAGAARPAPRHPRLAHPHQPQTARAPGRRGQPRPLGALCSYGYIDIRPSSG